LSQVPEKTELSAQALRLIEIHSEAIAQAVAETGRKLGSAGSVLAAACSVLNQRARYVGAAGEHFSVHEYDGIQVLDALDERLLRELRALLAAWMERARRAPDPKARELLAERLTPGVREMPPYPVGYMVHYLLVTAIRGFEPLAAEGHGFELPALETAMIHHLQALLDRYVETREKPVTRHFSDVAREHNVILRLKCGCGQERFQVKSQALFHAQPGPPYDRLDLECGHCGSRRSVTFDLPHFRDMVQI
jgi:hypothetical protein